MNKQQILTKRPVGLPDATTWDLQEKPIPQISDGEVLIKIHYISLDPAMRGWMNDVKSYIEPVQVGDVMRAGTVGEVIESKNDKLPKGTFCSGWGGVQQYVVTNGKGWYSVDPKLAPLPMYIGTLGMPGMTAYFGLLEVGQPKAGETVVVSGAAGAVGSIVGQIAKIKGCKVIGIAGGKDKCDYLINELGFDAAIDYKEGNLNTELKQKCPNGVDVYFDNVGGVILDAVLTKINMKARIVICGAISQYNNTTAIKGPSNYLSLLVNRAKMEGMVVLDYASKYGEAAVEMAGWLQTGKLKSKEHVVDGIENFYDAFLKLFSGDKLGKLVLKVLD
ncbi:NADP-dependent oxidoreductase [Reichenbachiella sp. MALMAid0571]|uniref:NADP-dependent oxidoreductase n=1 Tax=Reichenbachiella sp. MALMAid0571 TaxID=3143939 RepID=UPI0032DF919A